MKGYTHAKEYVRWVYLFQLRWSRGKSSECQPAYHAAETREELVVVEPGPRGLEEQRLVKE